MEWKRMRNWLIVVGMVTLFYLSGVNSATAGLADMEMPLFYVIKLKYLNGEIILLDKNLTNTFPLERHHFGDDYTLRLISFRGEELHNVTFDFPLEISITPPRECIENGTFVPERCPEHRSYVRLNESIIVLKIPYWRTGKSVKIYDKGGKEKLFVDVGEYSNFCGNGRCDEGEDYFLCPKECPSGVEDKYCDGVKDGKCDPDCSEDGDPDCIKSIEKGGLSQFMIPLVIAAVMILLLVFMFILKKSPTETKRQPL